MSLRHRLGLGLILGLVLGLALLGRELLRPNDTERAPAKIENVAAVADDPEPAAAPEIAQPAPTVTPAPNVPSTFGTFRGRVIDAVTRQPVREFELEFHAQHQPQPGDQPPGARTFRTKDGRFEWPGIPPRLWLITASARGYQRFEVDQLQIPTGAATTEFVMSLQRGQTLRGRVYDETSGIGIASATIGSREAHVGRYEGNFGMRVRTNTRKDGSFVLDGMPTGSIILSVSAPEHTRREIDVLIDEKMSPLQIGLSTGGSISGYLAGPDGLTPIAGWAGLFNLDENHSPSARTSDAGEFSFKHLPPGRYQLRGRASGQTAELEFSLGKDERRDGIVLAVSAGRIVRGVVRGVSPADLDQVTVTMVSAVLFRDIGKTGVDARGAFEVHGVEPGQVTVKAAISRRREISKTVQVPADSDVTVDFEFPRGARLTGNVTRGGKPVANAWLEPRAASQQKLWIYGARTSERGEYVIEDVPNGEYFILSGNYHSRNFEVSGDTVFDIDVPLAQFSGRTVEEGGKVPLVGVDVFIWSTQSKLAGLYLRERSDHFGEFAIAGLEPGNYLLSAYKPGYEMHRERISYGSSTESMTIGLRPGRGVEVRLREAGSGRPIRNAQLGETIEGRPGSGLRLHLDENGVAYIPRALAGSTLTFHVSSYVPAVVSEWGGEELDLQLERRSVQ